MWATLDDDDDVDSALMKWECATGFGGEQEVGPILGGLRERSRTVGKACVMTIFVYNQFDQLSTPYYVQQVYLTDTLCKCMPI